MYGLYEQGNLQVFVYIVGSGYHSYPLQLWWSVLPGVLPVSTRYVVVEQ